MTAVQVRNLLLKQSWIILICTFLGVGGALIGTLLTPPLYQATVTLHAVVSPQTPNTYALLVLDRLVGTEAQLAVSPPILKTVAAKYPGVSASSLKSKVTATAVQNTQLLQVTVTDSDQRRAAELANALAAALIADEQNTLKARNLQAEQQVQQELNTTQASIQSVSAKLKDPNLSPSDAASLNAQLQSLRDQYSTYLQTKSQL